MLPTSSEPRHCLSVILSLDGSLHVDFRLMVQCTLLGCRPGVCSAMTASVSLTQLDSVTGAAQVAGSHWLATC